MKRFFTIILAAWSMQLIAQVNMPTPCEPHLDVNRMDLPVRNHPQSLNKTNSTSSGWFNYVNGLKNSGFGTIANGVAPNIEPDSLLNVVYKDATTGSYQNFYCDMHAIGMVLDPKSEVYGSGIGGGDDFQMNRNTKYNMDSFAFSYIYNRYSNYTDDDTLIIQFYSSPAASGISKNYLTSPTLVDSPNVAIMNFDQNTGLGKNSLRTVTYLLNSKDTSVNFGVFNLQVTPALNINAGQVIGATVLFKSARPNFLGDTLTNDTNLLKIITNKHNQFRMYLAAETTQFLESNSKKSDPTPIADRIWQNTEIMITEVKYGLFTGWNETYWPGDLYKNIHYQVDMDFHLNATNVGINAAAREYLKDVQIYPNPSNGANAINVEYKLTKTANVSIEVVNILGKTLSYANLGKKEAGTQTKSINVSDLANGIYFAKITVDGTAQTVKFTVSK
jgi:hypothetical protein